MIENLVIRKAERKDLQFVLILYKSVEQDNEEILMRMILLNLFIELIERFNHKWINKRKRKRFPCKF